MARHYLPSKIKAQEIGKAQQQYLLFRNRLKLDQSFKSKHILEPQRKCSPESFISVVDNIEPLDMPLDIGQSSKFPHEISDLKLSETEDSLWNELTCREEQAKAHFISYATSSNSN